MASELADGEGSGGEELAARQREEAMSLGQLWEREQGRVREAEVEDQLARADLQVQVRLQLQAELQVQAQMQPWPLVLPGP